MVLERLLVIITSAYISFKHLDHEKNAGFLLFHAALFVATSLRSIQWQEVAKSLKFRPLSQSGVELGCLLVPMVLTSQLRFGLRDSMAARGLWTSYLISAQLMSMTTACICLLANRFKTLGAFMAFATVTSCLGVTISTIWGNDPMWHIYLLLAYLQFLYVLIKLLPQSFTLGEAMIISQGLVLVCTDAIMVTHQKLKWIVPHMFEEPVSLSKLLVRSDVTNILQAFVVGFLVMGFMLCPVYYYLKLIGNGLELLFGYLIFYCVIVLSAMVALVPMLYMGLGGVNPLDWLLRFISLSHTRTFLILYWAALVLAAVFTVVWFYFFSASSQQILIRKYFHVLAVGIFLPGIVYDPTLIHLAASGATVVFILLEYFRVGGIVPIGDMLHSCLSTFTDSRDSGRLILTHVYLLVGCAIPLWLYPESFYSLHKVPAAQYLSLYSGILSLGIGDTMASFIGINFGKHLWTGNSKTIEGTIAATVSQLVVVFLLCFGSVNPSTVPWFPVIISIVLVSLLEAWTSQIDNLVLPLFLYSLLNTICR